MARDPVCGRDVSEREEAITTERGNSIYFFCDTDCKRRFDHDPETYVLLPVEHLVSMLANRFSLR